MPESYHFKNIHEAVDYIMQRLYLIGDYLESSTKAINGWISVIKDLQTRVEILEKKQNSKRKTR